MASSWTHAAAAVAIAATLTPRAMPKRTWVITALAAALPDIDAVGRLFLPGDTGDIALLGGHRALTHSIAFAAVFALILLLTALRPLPQDRRLATWAALALAIASHGALDAMTTYGEGVAFLAPFSDTRYRALWPLVGDGIVRDTVAFVLFASISRAMLLRRDRASPNHEIR